MDSETGVESGRLDAANPAVAVMRGLHDLRFAKIDWRFIRVDGGEVATLRPAFVRLGRGLEWRQVRVLSDDGTEVFRFGAVTHAAALPPGSYVIEIDDSRIPFAASEGELLDIGP